MSCLDTAFAAHAMGYPVCVVPAGEKGPRGTAWQLRRYSREELEAKFKRKPEPNIGLILGPSASGLIDIECDEKGSENDLKELFGGKIPKTPCWKSKRGKHYLFQYHPRLEAIGKAVAHYKKVEVRLGCGKKGAQSLLPPSKTDGRIRKWIVPLSRKNKPAKLRDAVVERILIENAPPEPKTYVGKCRLGTPGGDFNTSAEWKDILEPFGWIRVGESGETVYWRRPGKKTSISATTGFCKSDEYDLFYCFTDQAPPFKQGRAYSRFAAYAILEHGGDYKKAAAALREKGYGTKKGQSVASMLVGLVEGELFHTPAGDAYIAVTVGDHKETMKSESKAFKSYLGYLFYGKTGGTPSMTALSEAINVLVARAKHEGPAIEVYTRLAEKDGFIYLDRGDPMWEAIKIGPDGYEFTTDPPVKFRRPKGMLEIPRPVDGGSLDELKPFVNCDAKSWPLITAFMVGAMNPNCPQPIGLCICDQGACKSSTMKAVRRVFDPNEADLRGSPENVKDLVIAAQNGRIVALDNLSSIKPWLADALCRIATGGGLGCRQLYSDDEESLFRVQNPVMVTAIEELTKREDFLDRCLLIHLPFMPSTRRDYERELTAAYEEARPRILGALLKAVSAALKNWKDVKLKRVPRMADFARWVTAAEPGLGWQEGDFMRHYTANRKEANQVALSTPLAAATLAFANGLSKQWSGTATELLAALKKHATDDMQTDPSWPRGHNVLSGRLRRMRVDLRKGGVLVSLKRRTITVATKHFATSA